jgi:hypothetical protein
MAREKYSPNPGFYSMIALTTSHTPARYRSSIYDAFTEGFCVELRSGMEGSEAEMSFMWDYRGYANLI